MENSLPDKYKESFGIKVKRFFTNLFRKKELEKPKRKEDILDMIKNNPKLIETLSVSQLEEINNMYDKIIEENDRKISKLRMN